MEAVANLLELIVELLKRNYKKAKTLDWNNRNSDMYYLDISLY